MPLPILIGLAARVLIQAAARVIVRQVAKTIAKKTGKKAVKQAAKNAKKAKNKAANNAKTSNSCKKCQQNKGQKPPLRKKYEEEVKGLEKLEKKLRDKGSSDEEIARILHKARRSLGEKYKDLTPTDELKLIHARNVKKYGDKLGPSINYLRSKGKSWNQIIESAKRPGGKDLGY